MCVRRCVQHWRKWAHRQKSPLDQWQHCDNSNNSSKNISSHKAINGMNAEWISIVKYVHKLALLFNVLLPCGRVVVLIIVHQLFG